MKEVNGIAAAVELIMYELEMGLWTLKLTPRNGLAYGDHIYSQNISRGQASIHCRIAN
jgi:hypothetical protein